MTTKGGLLILILGLGISHVQAQDSTRVDSTRIVTVTPKPIEFPPMETRLMMFAGSVLALGGLAAGLQLLRRDADNGQKG